VRKCPYCDFNSHALEAGQPSLPEDEYLSALCTDLESALPLVWGRQVVSVFIGGGTPSLLSAAAVERLLSDLRARLPLVPDCEITLEANPGTFEAGRFAAYRRAGVNRLSIGIQSFDDGRLQVLGRIHDRRQALQAVEIARGNFENFNLDLMYALPGQTLETARQDLETALQLRPPHLSLYQLTLEPNTVFARYPPRQLPDEDTAAAIQELIEKVTAEGGYEHYEVSAYAQPGHACRHNLNYWMFGDYLGIGAGAHGKLTVSGRILRQQRFRQPASYLANARAFRRRRAHGVDCGAAVRVHAQRASADRGIRPVAVRRAYRAAARLHCARAGCGAGARPVGAGHGPDQAKRARSPLPQRPPGHVPDRAVIDARAWPHYRGAFAPSLCINRGPRGGRPRCSGTLSPRAHADRAPHDQDLSDRGMLRAFPSS
jgi:putative oxygen-independent coproporphyrinogen III oxidase